MSIYVHKQDIPKHSSVTTFFQRNTHRVQLFKIKYTEEIVATVLFLKIWIFQDLKYCEFEDSMNTLATMLSANIFVYSLIRHTFVCRCKYWRKHTWIFCFGFGGTEWESIIYDGSPRWKLKKRVIQEETISIRYVYGILSSSVFNE